MEFFNEKGMIETVNLPNKLTLFRICLIPIFVFFMLADFIPHKFLISLIIFSLASYTDHLDGKIARRDHLITNFGKLMDPLADKMLVMSALICFVKLDLAFTACVIIIMFREFAVTSIRLIAVEQGKVIAANNWGKIKTVSQIVSVILILSLASITEFVSLGDNILFIFDVIGEIGILISTFFTVVSGAIYVKDAAYIFKDM